MKHSFPYGLFLLLIGLVPAPSLWAQDFIYEAKERQAHELCQLNFGRGAACESLIDRLCNRINNDNRECASLRAKQCQKANREKQTDDEASCEKGSHAGPCFGVNEECGPQEFKACQLSDYGERYCDYYFWQHCRAVVGVDGSGHFKDARCRKFSNEKMSRFYERRIETKLSWEPKGENSIASTLKSLNEAKENLEKQIEEIDKELDGLSSQIMNAVGQLLTQLKEQRKKAEESRREAKRNLDEVKVKIGEYSHMEGLCKSQSPIRGN